MTITVRCPCGKVLKTPDAAAGKSGKCPGCGKVMKIPISKTKQQTQPLKDDLLLSETKDGLITSEEKVPRKCPNCRATVYDGDAFCVTCGREIEPPKKRSWERRHSILQHPFARYGMGLIALGAILWCAYLNFLKPGENTGPSPRTPVEALRDEIAKPVPDSFEPLVKAMVRAHTAALPTLQAEFHEGAIPIKVNAAYGMLILAYHGRFDLKQTYYELDIVVNAQNNELKMVALDILYLISASQPELEFVQRGDEIKKYKSYFKSGERAAPIPEAKSMLRRFRWDSNELIVAKTTGYFVLLGDKARLDALAEFLTSQDSEAQALSASFLTLITGQPIRTHAAWLKWRDEQNKKPEEKE